MLYMVHDSEWCEHLPDVCTCLLEQRTAGQVISQDFVADALNPNIDGLLTNINRSYEAVIDENGNQLFKACFVHLIITGTSDRKRDSKNVSLTLTFSPSLM